MLHAVRAAVVKHRLQLQRARLRHSLVHVRVGHDEPVLGDDEAGAAAQLAPAHGAHHLAQPREHVLHHVRQRRVARRAVAAELGRGVDGLGAAVGCGRVYVRQQSRAPKRTGGKQQRPQQPRVGLACCLLALLPAPVVLVVAATDVTTRGRENACGGGDAVALRGAQRHRRRGAGAAAQRGAHAPADNPHGGPKDSEGTKTKSLTLRC